METWRDEYGRWVAGLAPWTHFATLTHDPRRLARPGERFPRIGVSLHDRRLREWFFDRVRPLDRGAVWWSETEWHITGQPHEHGLLAVSERAPLLSMRQAWYEDAGYARLEVIRDSADVAAYCAKYGAKVAARPPRIYGLGVHGRESFSMVAPGLLR